MEEKRREIDKEGKKREGIGGKRRKNFDRARHARTSAA